MRVKLLAEIAGPMGVHRIGEEADLEDFMAASLIDRGYAFIVQPEATTVSLEPEALAVDQVEEPKRRGRPRKV